MNRYNPLQTTTPKRLSPVHRLDDGVNSSHSSGDFTTSGTSGGEENYSVSRVARQAENQRIATISPFSPQLGAIAVADAAPIISAAVLSALKQTCIAIGATRLPLLR